MNNSELNRVKMSHQKIKEISQQLKEEGFFICQKTDQVEADPYHYFNVKGDAVKVVSPSSIPCVSSLNEAMDLLEELLLNQ